VDGLRPALRVYGREHVPDDGAHLLKINHYSRPGFHAWWLPLAVNVAVPLDVHWIMTAAWTYPDWFRAHTVTPLSRWLFGRIAQVYGFTSMPPMPPAPEDVAVRAAAVRRVLAYTRHNRRAVIGLAPEGSDDPDGKLQWPPNGSGRFMLHLAKLGLDVVPIGGFEANGAFCLRFGPAYRLSVPSGLSGDERDREARRMVMERIAAQLPARLRGEFAGVQIVDTFDG
jgi:1-acyl-sn-glycerol-3-phosphate acyltransferase